jgi:hypothetical protein
MPGTQTLVNGDATGWITIDFLRGVTLLCRWRSQSRMGRYTERASLSAP